MIGVGVSVGLMALALFFLRLNGSLDAGIDMVINSEKPDAQTASVVMSDSSPEGLSKSLAEAMDGSRVEKLVISDVTLGTGEEVKEGDAVSVHYIGTLQNGQEFDNSYKKGSTFTFTVGKGNVIEGWEKGVLGMKAGGQRILVIPSTLAYGSEGFGPIPANATLVFAIELVEIK